jgi:hypothetical protein
MGEYNINGSFISTYSVSINNDEDKDLKYSSVPVTPISLPNDMGLFQVSYKQDQFNTFVRMSNGSFGLYNGLSSGGLLGRVGYFVESSSEYKCDSKSGVRVYYNNMEDCTKDVLIKVVATSEHIDEDEPFPIAPEMESIIIRSVVELYAIMRNATNDEQNDNID